ncbi:MAG: hypothetical protein J5661_08680 [Bacteroidaceae bacterium]|nr:hypothetical protein [Bacteroidaceae bacterium]
MNHKMNDMKRLSILLFIICLSHTMKAADQTARLGKWTITYSEAKSALKIVCGNHTVLDNVCPEAAYQDATGKTYYISSTTLPAPVMKKGRETLVINFHKSEDVQFTIEFQLIDDYLLCGAKLSSSSSLKSNYLAPICINQPYPLFAASESNRMLKVPFDNDDFVRYHQYPFGSEMTSFEVGAFYQGETREGLIIGSVDHDHWKSGLVARTSLQGDVERLRVYSGMSHRETRDVLPHGSLRGNEIRSARFFITYTKDWRDGMEQFAKACLKVVPGRHNWTHGTPFGWQSWGVMSDKNSFQVDVAVSNYFHDVLQPGDFCNEQGKIVMSIDAWDNLQDSQKDELCKICKANNQIPGTYWTPFCLWWDARRIMNNKLPGQDKYMAHECILKANGKYLKYDGAYCLDPTHPGVKAWIDAEIRKIKAHGFEYLKVDFTDNGMIQADSYYNPDVHTGVEAYNEGFTYFCKKADEGTPLYIALSIAPIFPYQYGNSRRIACDTWGRIKHTEYSMNAISGGWWTSLLYQYNDPDHCPLIGNEDALQTTLSENRARITNLMCAGMALVCDNFDLEDKSGRGDAKLSRERAPQVMMNREVNAVGRLGRSFRPIYGYQEFQGKHEGAENFFQLDTEECTYVAVFNYGKQPLQGTLPLKLLGLKSVSEGYELWTQTKLASITEVFTYDVPAMDARLYKLVIP